MYTSQTDGPDDALADWEAFKAARDIYAELLGKEVTFEGDGAAMIGVDGDQPVLFQEVEEYVAPQWPDPAHPQQLHLDVNVDVDDLEEAERQTLGLGATRLPGSGENWRVYADPAGHPFCLYLG